MNIPDIFSELMTTYNKEWFEDSLYKFKNHPSNVTHDLKFNINCFDDSGNNYIKELEFLDFLEGDRDDSFDKEYEKKMQLDYIKTKCDGNYSKFYIEQIYNGPIIFESPYYHTNNLATWKNKIFNEIDFCMSYLNSLFEKDKFFNYITRLSKETKETIEASFTSTHKEILLKTINQIIEDISKKSNKTGFLLEIIENQEDRLNLNITQAQLAKLIFLLKNKELFYETSESDITSFFIKYCTVRKGKKNKNPITLSDEYRRLKSEKKNKKMKEWANAIELNL